jgi:UDP-glucose 4-epimerase
VRHLVTGCAGFLGSTLTERLLAQGHSVVGYDNFSTGREAYLQTVLGHPAFELVRADLLETRALTDALRGIDVVYHLAANADVRRGTEHPAKDLEQNTIATHNVLEAMRRNRVTRIAFASSAAIYGDCNVIPIPEDAPFPVQTSLYGASKAAAEGLISAYCTGFGLRAHVFRCASIVGERYSHGHIVDFYRQLRSDPARLRVLGDGRQRKAYVYVHDCIDAIFAAMDRASGPVNLFNIAAVDSCEVSDSVAWICAALGVTPKIEYSGGDRGWSGDNPMLILDTQRIRALGWYPRISIHEGVLKTLAYLRAHPWVLDPPT